MIHTILIDLIKMEDVERLPDDCTNYDMAFKVTVIGDTNTGKTFLIFNEEINYKFSYNDFTNFIIKYHNRIIKLLIWDTPGAEMYRSLSLNY